MHVPTPTLGLDLVHERRNRARGLAVDALQRARALDRLGRERVVRHLLRSRQPGTGRDVYENINFKKKKRII